MNNTLYYIYEIVGVKIGCTIDPVRRVERQQGFSYEQYIILETHTDINLASKREKELQVEKGYHVELSDYKNIIEQQRKVATSRRGKPGKKVIPWTYTKEAIANRIKNTDTKRLGRLTSQRQKNKPQPQLHTPEVRKKASENTKKRVAAYTKNGVLFKIFKSPTDAAIELNVRRGIIYDTLAGRQKTCRGYIWKYI